MLEAALAAVPSSLGEALEGLPSAAEAREELDETARMEELLGNCPENAVASEAASTRFPQLLLLVSLMLSRWWGRLEACL